MAAQAISEFVKYKNYFWLLVSIAVGFGLRAYMLGAQSLWNDEGISVALAPLSLEAIADGAAKDIHPPLYYVLLHFWIPLAGQSEFAVRFLSVIAGVLLIALTYRIARTFFDREVAIISAFLAAFSPFQVYYSQEARMYIWVTMWAALSMLALVLWLKVEFHWLQGRASGATSRAMWGCWLLYIASAIAMLYSQYVGAFVVLAQNAALVVWLGVNWVRENRPESTERKTAILARVLGRWVAAQAMIGLAFLPWYLRVGNQIATWPSISEPFDLPTLLWRFLNISSVGITLDPGSALPIALAFLILFAFGLKFVDDRETNMGMLALLLWMAVPLAIMYIVSLMRPAYNAKLLLVATPPFLILAARGLSAIHPGIFLHKKHPSVEWRSLRFFFFGVAVIAAIGFIPALRSYYSDPRYARDDYRAILAAINAAPRAGDGILVDDKGQIDAVRYYNRTNQKLFLLPRMRPAEPSATRADVDEMLATSRRLFAIYYATDQGDPQGIVESRLAESAFKASDEWYGNVRLAVYGVTSRSRPAAEQVGARLGEISLSSFQLDAREWHSGDVLTLSLNWRADQVPTARYKVFVHLLDRGGQVVAQRDGEPVADRRITTTWRAGETIADNYGIWLDDRVPAGEYQIEVGMYSAGDGTRLAITGPDGSALGDHLILGTVQVVPEGQ